MFVRSPDGGGGSPAAVVVETPPPAASVETVADASVEIAEVNAEASVAIAEVQADASVAIAEVTATDDEDMQWLRAELTGLRALCETNAVSLSNAEAAIQQQSQQIADLTTSLEVLALIVNPPTPQPNSPETPETPEEVLDGNAAGDGPRDAPEEPARPVKKSRRRWL